METRKSSKLTNLLSNNLAWVILTILVIIFSIFSKNFFSVTNILNILSQNVYVLIIATGCTFLLMSGHLDLSIGYSMSTIGVIMSVLMLDKGVPFWICMIIGILIAIIISLANTWLMLHLKLDLFIVTIATMTILQGASNVISQSRTFSGFPDAFKFLGQEKLYGIFPISILIMIVIFFAMSFVLNRTYYGRYVYALGGNKESARLAGINISRMRYSIAAIVGFFVGVGEIMLISRLGSTQSVIGPGTEFTILISMFLGGVSIRGGEGKLSGVFAAVLVLALLTNGMQLSNINIYYQFIVRGLIMISAIGFDVYQLNRRNSLKKVKGAK